MSIRSKRTAGLPSLHSTSTYRALVSAKRSAKLWAPVENKTDLPLPPGSSQARPCTAGCAWPCGLQWRRVETSRKLWKILAGRAGYPPPPRQSWASCISGLSPAQWGGEYGCPWASGPGSRPPLSSKPLQKPDLVPRGL